MKRQAKWVLLAAISSVSILAVNRAGAQVRVSDNPGGALDANNRVGSGGRNDGQDARLPTGVNAGRVTGNDIVNGTVTGLSYFHGGVPYASPYDFRGNLGSSGIDPFLARSAGSYGPNQGGLLSMQPEQFFGNRTVTAPPGFAERDSTGTYHPQLPSTVTQPISGGIPVDARLMLQNEMLVPGLVDPTTGLPGMMTTSSPLMGVRNWTQDELNRASALLRRGNPASEDAIRRLGLDRRTIEQMQEELKPNTELQPGIVPSLQGGQLVPNRAPGEQTVGVKPLESALANPLGQGKGPEAGISTRLTASALAQQSQQYAEMQRKLDRFYGVPETAKTEEDRNRELRNLVAKQKTGFTEPGLSWPDMNIRNKLAGGTLSRPPQGPRAEPLKITSLADGIKAPGLKSFLVKAEELMKQGKFMAALDQYNVALAVSPEQLVVLGRANAELGGGLYERAATDLRRCLWLDPVLTMAQFDLRQMMGQDRVETIVRDLKTVAQKQESEPTPVLLLAYLAYNTGNEAQAGIYLDLAQRRAGGNDSFIKLLQTHWRLPVQAEAAEPATTRPVR